MDALRQTVFHPVDLFFKLHLSICVTGGVALPLWQAESTSLNGFAGSLQGSIRVLRGQGLGRQEWCCCIEFLRWF